jgi:hypothetical protein
MEANKDFVFSTIRQKTILKAAKANSKSKNKFSGPSKNILNVRLYL